MESTVTLPEEKGRKKIPAWLVKEEFDGVPLYYKGYKDVLSGKKTLEEIIGCSGIQSLIVTYLTILLANKLNKNFTAYSPERWAPSLTKEILARCGHLRQVRSDTCPPQPPLYKRAP
ncbi:MAG: hypothetical protein ACE5FF_06565 [Saprospiraceae bacterium]